MHGTIFKAEKKRCKFKTGKVILQRPIEREQIVKLLSTGRTDLLDKFISNKTGRAFSAFLVVGADGKTGFEFPERESEPSEDKASDSRKTAQSK